MSVGFTGRPLRVLGIDFGSASIKVAAKVNNVVTDVSLNGDRDTLPTHLCFRGGEILFGSNANHTGTTDILTILSVHWVYMKLKGIIQNKVMDCQPV